MLRSGGVLASGVVLAMGLLLSGCGGSSAVEGTVTFKGQPIEKGGISFVAKNGGGSAPLTVGEDIANGKFSVASDRGLKPGTYKVEIYGSTKAAAPASADPDMQSPASSNAIPEKYNAASELTAELTSGNNTVSFDLQP